MRLYFGLLDASLPLLPCEVVLSVSTFGALFRTMRKTLLYENSLPGFGTLLGSREASGFWLTLDPHLFLLGSLRSRL